MTFDWREYRNVADKLFNQRLEFSSEEACCRIVISRAYYSAFCLARNRARDMKEITLVSGGDVHKQVINHYKQSPTGKARVNIGIKLDRLRLLRNTADYDDTLKIHNPVKEAEAALRQAEDVYQLLQLRL
jgi:uncharacterized protein (UPF0332 family)